MQRIWTVSSAKDEVSASGASRRIAFRARIESLVKCVVKTRALSRLDAISEGRQLIRAPSRRALVIAIASEIKISIHLKPVVCLYPTI